jgi:radical SAM protein with 4Fe4S-binding SPASM domain
VMKDELFEKIARELQAHASEVKRVHLYRDGEPLLDKRLASRISTLKRIRIREVGISTNAQILDADRSLAILSAGLDEIILSIDSVYPNVYAKIRVGLDWETVTENAQRFFQLRDGLRSKCRIRVRMIRQELNEHEWYHGRFQAQWLPYLKGNDTVEYRDLHNWGGQLGDFKPIVHAATDKPCLALWSLMTIFADGSVPLCNVDYNKKFPLGNVKDSTIAELWQSHEQNRRRDLHMSGNRKALAPCANCTVWSEKVAA